MTNSLRRYRRILIGVVAVLIVITIQVIYQYWTDQIPDQIILQINREHQIHVGAPVTLELEESLDAAPVMLNHKEMTEEIHVTPNQSLSLQAMQPGHFTMEARLFGLFPCKNVAVNMVEEVMITPCGIPIGIYAKTDGLLVLGTGVLQGKDGLNYEPAAGIVKTGDYVKAMNGVEVSSIMELALRVNEAVEEEVKLTVVRGGQNKVITTKRVKTSDGTYKLGVWLREDTQGIGTLTYATQDGEFGALGHGITDSEAGVLVKMEEGNIYPAKVLSIIRGKKGTPGEISGSIQMSAEQVLGSLNRNTKIGIFGYLNRDHSNISSWKSYPLGYRQDIRKGKASIICQLDGEREEYQIRIERINFRTEGNKGMVIHITDPRLLAKTGGIIQGMSGSPILQNGRFVGAVTHVFVNDPTKGYGIFAETMLE